MFSRVIATIFPGLIHLQEALLEDAAEVFLYSVSEQL